ncbi:MULTISPECIES: CsbD family protein [unclassified Aureispira]|nr:MULTISPECIES: CsbD family protein [unclassified Aureispira]WMX17320.1 CsbD family protein [Aureispira sp. CCB-E]
MKQKYAELTEDDLMYRERKEDEMLGHLQQKLGKSKREINDYINSIGN